MTPKKLRVCCLFLINANTHRVQPATDFPAAQIEHENIPPMFTDVTSPDNEMADKQLKVALFLLFWFARESKNRCDSKVSPDFRSDPGC